MGVKGASPLREGLIPPRPLAEICSGILENGYFDPFFRLEKKRKLRDA
jgi:hypothetical protein